MSSSSGPASFAPDVVADVAQDAVPPRNVDAGLAVCGAACVDPKTSAANCGACGHDCGGGTCVASVCQPIILATITGVAANELTGIATDGKYVAYTIDDVYSNGGVIYSLSVSGTNQTPTTIGSSTVNQKAGPLKVVNGRVYWLQSDGTTPTTAWKGTANKTGATKLGFVTGIGSGYAFGLAIDSTETYLDFLTGTSFCDGGGYCTTWGAANLQTQASLGSSTATLTYAPGAMANDDANAYWTERSGMVMRMPIAFGSAAMAVVSNQLVPTLIAVDATGGYLYWDQSALSSNQITRAQIASPTPGSIATGQPMGIVADTKYVYWTDGAANALEYAAVTGTSKVQTLVPSLKTPWALTKDGKALYWLNRATARFAKWLFRCSALLGNYCFEPWFSDAGQVTGLASAEAGKNKKVFKLVAVQSQSARA